MFRRGAQTSFKRLACINANYSNYSNYIIYYSILANNFYFKTT